MIKLRTLKKTGASVFRAKDDRLPARVSRSTMKSNTIWLRKRVLFAFMALFVLLAVSLILINYFATRHKGLPLFWTANHYSWTYGPTVMLVIIIGFWRRVCSCVMVNQPWHELYKGPQPASQTMLLDYLWPPLTTSFAAAVKNKHLGVAASVLIFTSLKLIVVISTTLFLPENSFFSQSVQVSLATRFDSTHF